MRQKRTILTIAGIAAAAFVAARLLSDPAPSVEAAAEVAAASAAEPTLVRPAISVVTVDKAVLADRVRASGLVQAVERVLIQPQIEGQAIDSVEGEVGDHVPEGAVLARLSDSALKLQKSQLVATRASALAQIAQADAQLIEAEAAAAEAERASDRATKLQQNGNASQAAADQAATSKAAADARVTVARQGGEVAKAQLSLVDAQLENIELQLSRTLIKAPFAGEIVEKNAVAGAIASAAGAPMFVLVRDGLLEMTADIAEQDLPRVYAGQTVSLRAAGLAAPLTGEVRLVEPAIDTQTRLGRARISIKEADLVRTGMFLQAEIEISEREVVAVPITAIGTDDLGSFVMTVDGDGKVHRAAVTIGVRDGGKIEILSGVEAGEQVVSKAASFVRDGDMVQPIIDAAAQGA